MNLPLSNFPGSKKADPEPAFLADLTNSTHGNTQKLYAMLSQMLISSASLASENDISVWMKQHLKLNRIVKEYFICFRNPAETYAHFYDEQATFAADPEFRELLEDSNGFGGNYNFRLAQSDQSIEIDVTNEFKMGGISPWVFFLKRIGTKSITGIPLIHCGVYIGVFWFESMIGDSNFQLSIYTMLSYVLYGLRNRQVLQKAIDSKLDGANISAAPDETKVYGKSRFEIIGSGAAVADMKRLIEKVSPSYATVLITGETGTGKELVARKIHELSCRTGREMVSVNCATLPPNLIESELFGHEKGSFTGALGTRIGKFEMADKGTLFLDEIGEMPMDLQVKLLRAIQEKEIQRVGGTKTIKIDVRVIAATNRDLLREVKEGRFRTDLYYRLNVFPIAVPPLRERIRDVEELALFFLSQIAQRIEQAPKLLSKSAVHQMMAYQWPGNIRELEHLMERSVLLNDQSQINYLHLPLFEDTNMKSRKHTKNLEAHERSYLVEVLIQRQGKISGANGAAKTLGIPASTLTSKIIRFKIQKEEILAS